MKLTSGKILLIFLLLTIGFYACKVATKQPETPAAAVPVAPQQPASTYKISGGYELIWEDNAENVSASEYNINTESLVFGKDVLFYIAGPKLPEGGSFTRIKALDLKKRELKWTYKFVHQHLTKIDREGNLVFVTGNPGFTIDEYSHVFALDAETGKEVWRIKIDFERFGGLYDMAVHNKVVYLLRERNLADQKMLYELVEVDANTGQITRVSELGHNFLTDMGLYTGPYFLTRMNPETLKKELVMPNGNLIVIGKKWLEATKATNNTSSEADVILAVSARSGKVAWEHINQQENAIAAWELSDKNPIVHFNNPLNAAGFKGLNLATGKITAVNKEAETQPHKYQRPQWTDYDDHELEVIQPDADYLIRYNQEDIFVYEIRKR